MQKLNQSGVWVAFLFTVGCGSGALNSSESPNLSTIPLTLTTDVGESLVRHFAPQATKPPANRQLPSRVYRFDFVEQSRTLSPEGNGIISGVFLFNINNQPSQSGLIELIYTSEGSVWHKTQDVRIVKTEVEAITLIANVRDSESGQPLEDVEVEARRPDGVRTSRTVRTDATGIATLEVLPGDFEISVDHPNFQPISVTTVHADKAQVSVGDIQLTPINKLIRTP